MRGFEMHHQEKGFLLFAVFDPVNRIVCYHICVIPRVFFPGGSAVILPVVFCFENRIEIYTLIRHDHKVIKARRSFFEMPFSYERSLIAGLLHYFGNIHFTGIQSIG